MRVVIADDHPVFLVGLKFLLREAGANLQLVGEARDGEELLKKLATTPCDLLVTDLSMPSDSDGPDGLSMLKSVRDTHPALPILVLTTLRNPAVAQNIIGLGAWGVIDKMAMTGELTLAIDVIRAGRRYMGKRLRKQIDGMHASGVEPVVSRREVEVIRYLVQGLSVSEVARRMERSVKTISQQKRDAVRKLSLESDKDLFDYARSSGFF